MGGTFSRAAKTRFPIAKTQKASRLRVPEGFRKLPVLHLKTFDAVRVNRPGDRLTILPVFRSVLREEPSFERRRIVRPSGFTFGSERRVLPVTEGGFFRASARVGQTLGLRFAEARVVR